MGGTKLVTVLALAVLLMFYLGWLPIALVTALVTAAVVLARIPRGALPSIPGWLWLIVLLGGGHRAPSPVVPRSSISPESNSSSAGC